MPTSDTPTAAAAETSATVTASSDAASWARVAYFVCVALAAGILAAWVGALGSGQQTSTGLHISYFLGFSVAVLSAWIVRRSRREYLLELSDLDASMEKIRTDAVAAERLLGLHREMTEDAGVGWYRLSSDGRLEAANLALALTLGFGTVEALRKVCKGNSFTGTTDRTSALNTLQTIGEIRNQEIAWPSAQGRRIRLIESARSIRDTSGQIMHIEGVAIAATGGEGADRRAQKAEAALSEALERIKALESRNEPDLQPAAPDAAEPVEAPETPRPPDTVEASEPAAPIVWSTGKTAVAVRHVVEQALAESGQPAADRRVELAYRIAADLPAIVASDSDSMAGALQNLIEFAVRNASRGSLVVHASLGTGVAGATQCQYEIRCTGAAVSPAELSRAFEADDLREGTGSRAAAGDLSAAIGRQHVEHLGGGLRLETSPDGRFTVHVAIPVETVPDADATDGRPVEGVNVLLVDDHETSRSFLMHLLEDAGAAVRAAGRSGDAADLIEAEMGTDVIVASLSSARGAAEFVGHLKRVDADRRPPLVLVVPPDMGDASSEGRSGTRIAKPVRRDKLIRAVEQALLERAPRPDPSPEVEPALPTPPTAEKEGFAVLVADDDPVNGYLMVRILENLGHDVTLVTTGPDAVEAFNGRAFDAAVMDIRMPVLSGPEASRRILENIGPGHPRPLLIGMTASTSAEDRELCLSAGMHTCLVKPVTPEDFTEAVESFRSATAPREEHPRSDRPSEPSRHIRRPAGGHEGYPDHSNGHHPEPGPGSREVTDAIEEVRSYLEAHHGDEPAFMAELLAVYLRNAPGLIRSMVEHQASGDFDTVRQSAQALKSSCRLIGFARLSALCRALEVAVTGDATADTVAPFIESIDRMFHRARPALDAERAELVHLDALQASL